MTKAEHYQYVILYTQQFAQTTGVSPELVYQLIDYVIRRIWKTIAPHRPQDYRKLATLNHGDRLPVDWTQYAGEASYVDGGGTRRPFHYIHPEQIGEETTNSYGIATANWPAIYIEDMKIMTLPAGLTNIDTWFFNRPAQLTGAADNTDDGMPAWCAQYVHIGTAQALIEMTGQEEKSDEVLIKRQKESLEANELLFGKLEQAMQSGVQQTVKQ